MTEYDNTNRGSIWKNDKKEKDTQPDFKGDLDVNGVKYWVSAWKRKEGANPRSPALSFKLELKDEQPAASQQSISQRAMPKGPARDPISSGRVTAAGGGRPVFNIDDMNDDVPF